MVAAQQSSSEHAGCVVENTASMQVAAAACDENPVLVEATILSEEPLSSSGVEAGTVGARVLRARHHICSSSTAAAGGGGTKAVTAAAEQQSSRGAEQQSSRAAEELGDMGELACSPMSPRCMHVAVSHAPCHTAVAWCVHTES